MAQVQLFKKKATYTDKKTGETKESLNFYVKCGDKLIPINVPYFPDEKNDGRDLQYSSRKSVLSAFAETLPDKPEAK